MKRLALALLAFITTLTVNGQSADEIINQYFEATGGKAQWEKLEGLRKEASVNQGGMEIPITIIDMKDGREMLIVSLQGQEFIQSAYDGTDLWSTNFQTMKAEKADDEALANKKKEDKDFPDPLLNYASKGYSAEYVGKETMDGVETHKIKLIKKPMLVDGKEVENIEYYFFDTETSVLIAAESEIHTGAAKGTIAQVFFSDYQEVDGLYFPFSISQGIKGQDAQPLLFTEIVVNPDISSRSFAFPTE